MSGSSTYKKLIENIKILIKNVQKDTPFHKILKANVHIFNEDLKIKNIILQYLLKILLCFIILILPIIFVIYLFIIITNISSKNKTYYWINYKYNYYNTNNDYMNDLYNIKNIFVFTKKLTIFLISSILFISLYILILFKYKELMNNENFKKIINYNLPFFGIIFIVIIFYMILNINSYKNIYNNLNDINNYYINYLNKDYIKNSCDFLDDNNTLNSLCNIKTRPTNETLRGEINKTFSNFKAKLDKNDSSIYENLENIDFNNDYSDKHNIQFCIKILSTLITHEWLTFLYNNKFTKKHNYNKMCSELSMDTIINSKIYNIYYCYPENIKFPFSIDHLDTVLVNIKENHFNIYMAIYNRYLDINNKIANIITKIKKNNVSETNIIILLFIIFIIYIIGLFFI